MGPPRGGTSNAMRCVRQLTFLFVSVAALACGEKEATPDAGSGGTSAGGTASGGTSSGGSAALDPWEAVASGVFVHLFEWPWADIAIECEEFLGPAGYSAVQVSPPNEHAVINGRPWWERYQPISYLLGSRSGDENAFLDMVDRCSKVGVDIYVDAVINHMAAQSSGIGSAGTAFTKYNFGDVWGPNDFHSPACGITQSDYVSDGHAVQNCELVGLADLDTSAAHVQEGLAQYLLRLMDLGVAGFRIDAAKHMAPQDIAGIFARVDAKTEKTPFVFLEVIDGVGEAISSADYLGLTLGEKPVMITEFRYLRLGETFRAPDLTSLTDFSAQSWGLLESDRAVVFTDNHDTQRGHSVSYRDGTLHQLANVFLLATPYGYPKLISSYSFTAGSGRDDGPPSSAEGATLGAHHPDAKPCVTTGSRPFDANTRSTLTDGRWVCEHRDPAMTAMVQFRRATAGAPVAHTWSSGPETLAFARTGKGFVVINHSGTALEETLQTGLPEGSYCDVIAHGSPRDCANDGRLVVDAQGNATVQVAPRSAAAFYRVD